MLIKRFLPVLLSLLAALCLAACASGEDAQPAQSPAAPAEKAAQANIIISEFMEKNRCTIPDEDGDFSDYIELYNADSKAVSLEGWTLSDSADKEGWAFPAVEIAPGEYLLVFASGKEKAADALHADFALSGDETIYLRDENGALVFEAPCRDCGGDEAMVYSDGTWAKSLWASPGFENSEAGYVLHQQRLSPAGKLVINEVMTFDKGLVNCDWVEIKNISDAPVEMSEYWLSDDDDNYALYNLPAGKLNPGQHYTLPVDDDITGFALGSDSEQLFLSHSDGSLADFCHLHSIPLGCSMGKQDGRAGFFYMENPSPDEKNNEGFPLISTKPESATPDGVYENVSSLSVKLYGEGPIYYTVDGSVPSAESTFYTGPIELDKTTVIRAVCYEQDKLRSEPLTLSYIINEGHSLPVMSLVTDRPRSFWQMYNGRQKGIEEPGVLSFYRDGEQFTLGCGISLNGETSLVMPKKNMSLRFRDVYGGDMLDFDIYGGGVTEFRNILLRSGQDFDYAIIRNELCQNICAMVEDTSLINQRSLWGILYINGEYSGLYTLKEKANEQLYASIAGISRESVELEEAPIFYGSAFYNEVVNFVMLSDMSIDENYERFCSMVDVDGYIDWLILEGFCGNTDMTHGNLRYVRSWEDGGKWKFMFYDLDATFGTAGCTYANALSEYAYTHSTVGAVAYPLMKNPEFKDKFLSRAAELYETVLTNETVLEEIDRLAAEIRPEVERDYARFTLSAADWEYDLQTLRDNIISRNWRQHCIDELCRIFKLEGEERAHYFGAIDGK